MPYREGSPINIRWATTDQELVDACASLPQGPLCLDTEFVRRSTYYPILALVQMSVQQEAWLIDPLDIDDWTPLIDRYTCDNPCVMHSASEDLEVLRHHMGALPDRLFDTQVAAAFVGLGASLSYAALVEQLLGVNLAKSQTQSDWLQRPLTEAQQHYALDDVCYLQEVYEVLMERLEQQNKLCWMNAYTQQTLDQARCEIEPTIAYQRIKGLHGLAAAELSLLKSLAEWREQTARRLNKPRNWLVRDQQMVKIARQRPASRRHLNEKVGMVSESIHRYGQAILELVEQHKTTSDEKGSAPSLAPGDRAIVKKLQSKVEDLAEQHDIAERLIANKAELEDLVRYKRGQVDSPALLSDWRANEFSQPLLEIINV